MIIKPGDKFGSITIIRQAESYKSPSGKKKVYEYICKCGNIKTALKSSILNNPNFSCGCDRGMRRRKPIIPGTKKNRLTILREVESKPRNDKPNAYTRFIECQCDCGKIFTTRLDQVDSNHSRSCGCIITDGNPNAIRKLYKSEQNIYHGLKGRCLNQSNRRYKDYGGRGIKVCDRWLESFYNFLEDMGPRPSKKHTLDRIENNGNYEPGNCRWTTIDVQNFNQRTNVLINPGDKYGNLTVIEEIETIKSKKNRCVRMIKCICDCGVVKNYRLHNLRSGKSQSCGFHTKPKVRRPEKETKKKENSNNCRFIYEKYFNVKIQKNNQIHHIDFNWKNNDPENLIELTTEQHGFVHRKVNIDMKNWVRHKLINFFENSPLFNLPPEVIEYIPILN